MQAQHTGIEIGTQTYIKLLTVLSGASLFLSGWALLGNLDDRDVEREVDRRLACLELPGPNDCGLDGR